MLCQPPNFCRCAPQLGGPDPHRDYEQHQVQFRRVTCCIPDGRPSLSVETWRRIYSLTAAESRPPPQSVPYA